MEQYYNRQHRLRNEFKVIEDPNLKIGLVLDLIYDILYIWLCVGLA